MIAMKSPLFSYHDCKFRVETGKHSTARVAIWKEFSVTNSFTLESSFYGYNRGEEIVAYNVGDYFQIGESFLHALLEYYYVLVSLEKEMIITRGWLKPSRLIALTGTPAADLLARKITEEKEALQRQKRISKVREALSAKKEKARSIRKTTLRPSVPSNQRTITPSIPRKTVTEKNIRTLHGTMSRKDSGTRFAHNISNGVERGTMQLSKAKKTESQHRSPIFRDCFLKSEDRTVKTADPSQHTREPEKADKNWREYFSPDEIEKAYTQMNKGIDPNDEEDDSEDASESNPSEDNLEQEEMKNFLLSIPSVANSILSPKNLDETPQEVSPVSEKYSNKSPHSPNKKINSKIEERKILEPSIVIPSIIITSKNCTKTTSLVRAPNATFHTTTDHINNEKHFIVTTRNRPCPNSSPFQSRSSIDRGLCQPRNFRMGEISEPERPKVVSSGVKNSANRRLVTASRNLKNRETRSSPHQCIVTPPPEFPATNFHVVNEPHPTGATINININSLNINTHELGDEYRSFYCQRSGHSRGPNRVLASIPRHYESAAFQRLFATSNKYQPEQNSEHKKAKKRPRMGETLSDLLLSTIPPFHFHQINVLLQRSDK